MKNRIKVLSTAILAVLPLWVQAGAIDQLRAFLDDTRSYKADFEQSVMGRNGRKPQQSSGTLVIQRPGKLRWEIVKPYPQLVVSDGEKVWIYDPDLQQVTVRAAAQAIGSSPAALLAGSKQLEKNFKLSEIGDNDGLTWIEAIPKTADSGFEKVRIGMSGKQMKAMILFDNFAQTTHINLLAAEPNPVLPAGLFRFVPPAGVDVIGD